MNEYHPHSPILFRLSAPARNNHLVWPLHQRPNDGPTDMFYRQYFRERWRAGYGMIGNGDYSLSALECGVSFFRTPFAAGSTLTVTVWSSRAVSIQVDSSPTTTSYETFNLTSSGQPLTLAPASGSVAPRTITDDAYFD